jgi:hypothetical protein
MFHCGYSKKDLAMKGPSLWLQITSRRSSGTSSFNQILKLHSIPPVTSCSFTAKTQGGQSFRASWLFLMHSSDHLNPLLYQTVNHHWKPGTVYSSFRLCFLCKAAKFEAFFLHSPLTVQTGFQRQCVWSRYARVVFVKSAVTFWHTVFYRHSFLLARNMS